MFHRLSLFILASLMLFATVANAQFPSCAQSCIGQASPGSCSLTDNTCMCQNASYCNATNNCFQSSCSNADWKTAYDYAVELCRQAGVTQTNVMNPPAKRTAMPTHPRRMHKVRI
ncbi:hypothetical protein B0J17DRAFT_718219 [Rhizoctonia solani]|nr:hypothetical protein B0J17DRAFT_718219 [Rhizoctonia solani]